MPSFAAVHTVVHTVVHTAVHIAAYTQRGLLHVIVHFTVQDWSVHSKYKAFLVLWAVC